jgi:nicotinate-nucleotide adenylyltransferase
MLPEPRDIGVLGGSFNPPHIGHLVIASEAHQRLGLQRVLFVPARRPPHKHVDDDVPAAVRLAMARLAVEGDPRFAVDSVEIDRGLVYTVDTLAALRTSHPGARLWFIVGSDSLLAFDTWRDPAGILANAGLAVALRPGDDPDEVNAAVRRWGEASVIVLASPLVGVSSSEVRARLREGRPVRYLVPDQVERFIREERLYAPRMESRDHPV